MREIESDGFITRDEDVKNTPSLEYYARSVSLMQSAHPSRECRYPRCEECSSYAKLYDESYCTVPMVVSKQIWHLTAEKLGSMEKRLTELETLVTDEILGLNK